MSLTHWVQWVGRGTGTPKDKDEVNKREVCECDGWVCDLDMIGAPSKLSGIRKEFIKLLRYTLFFLFFSEHFLQVVKRMPSPVLYDCLRDKGQGRICRAAQWFFTKKSYGRVTHNIHTNETKRRWALRYHLIYRNSKTGFFRLQALAWGLGFRVRVSSMLNGSDALVVLYAVVAFKVRNMDLLQSFIQRL